MKPTGKDFIREIKTNPGRFFSILFIVALGVAFFSGIRSSEPDMRITGDVYYDDEVLMDVKAISTLGITEDDVTAFGELSDIELAEGAYSADFLTDTGDNQRAIHVMSLPKTINRVTVTKGRLPETPSECLADDESDYKLGDEIVLLPGGKDPVSDTLKEDTLTVVGIGNTPCYISFNRGNTTIGTGTLYAYVMVPENAFDLDVYTECYMLVAGAKEETAYRSGYEDKIDDAMEQVKDLSGERGTIRRRELVDEATKELDKAKVDLEEGREKAQKEIRDAEAEINDGVKEIADAKQKIIDGRKEIADAKETLNKKQKELDDGQKEYEDGKKQLKEGKAQLKEGKEKLQKSEKELKKGEKEYEKGYKKYLKEKKKADAGIAEGEEGIKTLETYIAQAEAGIEQMEEVFAGLETVQTQIAQIEESFPPEVYGDPTNEVGAGYAMLKAQETVLLETIETEGLEEKYETTKTQLEAMKTQLAEAQAQVDSAKAQLKEAEKELKAAREKLDDGKAQLEAGKKELKKNEKLIKDNEEKLTDAKKQLEDGQKQIDNAWEEIRKNEVKLRDGEAEIAENEQKLEDARKELEEGRAKAAKKIAKGEKKIADAEKEIEDIPEASWYIYDRSTLPEYSGYGDNAARIGALGRVFPVLFFLVAALISLTSMTRMVEEQRVQIGTMKALGFSRWAITWKYLGYALLASVLGSMLGILVGEKVIPYVIIFSYGIMYHHMGEIQMPYVLSYGLAAAGIATLCTTAATFFSCYQELRDQPAQLMRPPAPKIGKRILLERIPFLWSLLNFSWKSSVRNLLRYKKRFFMTIFGIGGCMALMIVGYGILDSIYEVAAVQYESIQTYNGQIILQEDITKKELAGLEKYLEDSEDIEEHMKVYMKNVLLKKGKKERQTYITVLSDLGQVGDFVDFHDRITRESYTLDDEGVIISEKTAKLLGVGVGDTLTIKDEDTGYKDIKIRHICENYMGHYAYMTPAYYEKVFGEPVEYNSVLFCSDDSFTEEELEEVGKKLVARDEVLSISYMHDVQKQLNDILNSLDLVVLVLIISAGMLAFVVLYNLNTINITERQRELATLKVLGFYDPEVAIYVFRENVLLTILGAMIGVVLGKYLHRFTITTVEVDAAMFGRHIYLPSFLYSLFFTILFSLIINGVMYFKLKKINMVESLKSVE